MADRTTIERFEGDTLTLSGALKTSSTIHPSQWTNATAELVVISAGTRTPCELGGTVAIDAAAKRVTVTGATMPVAGSYYFRIRVTFADGSKVSFPNGAKWNTLRVIKSG